MSKRSKEEQRQNTDNLLHALLNLPVKNLESRVTQLEAEVQERKKLHRSALVEIKARELHLQELLHRNRYVAAWDPSFAAIREIESLLSRLQATEFEEQRSCFKDLSILTEKLHQAQSDLSLDRERLGLLKEESPSTSSPNYHEEHR